MLIAMPARLLVGNNQFIEYSSTYNTKILFNQKSISSKRNSNNNEVINHYVDMDIYIYLLDYISIDYF